MAPTSSLSTLAMVAEWKDPSSVIGHLMAILVTGSANSRLLHVTLKFWLLTLRFLANALETTLASRSAAASAVRTSFAEVRIEMSSLLETAAAGIGRERMVSGSRESPPVCQERRVPGDRLGTAATRSRWSDCVFGSPFLRSGSSVARETPDCLWTGHPGPPATSAARSYPASWDVNGDTLKNGKKGLCSDLSTSFCPGSSVPVCLW